MPTRPIAKKSDQPASTKGHAQEKFLLANGLVYWLIAVVLGLYTLYFLSQAYLPGSSPIRRGELLLSVLTIDQLLGMTVGADSPQLEFGISDRLWPLSLGCVWLAASCFIGRGLIADLSQQFSRLEIFGLRCLTGLGLLSTATMLLGWIGVLNRISLSMSVVSLCGMSYLAARATSSSCTAAKLVERGSVLPRDEFNSQIGTWLWRLLVLGCVLLGLMQVASALVPPVEFDVVEYHLQGPKEFYQTGQIAFSPHNVYLNMPLGVEMHALAMMVLSGGDDGWWLGGMAGKLIIASFSWLTAGLAAGFVARIYGTAAAWACAGLILASPGIIHVTGCGLIDGALTAYCLAVAVMLQLLLTKHQQTNMGNVSQVQRPHTQSPQLLRWLLLTCFLAGCATACKYTGLIFVAVPALALIGWLAIKSLQPRALPLAAVLMLLVFAIPIGPWLLKNLMATGNPVYPLASGVFGPGNLTADQQANWNRAHQVPFSASQSAYSWAAATQALMQIFVTSNNLPVCLIPLAICGALVPGYEFWRRRPHATRVEPPTLKRTLSNEYQPLLVVLSASVWISGCWWLLTHRIDRFWLPLIPLLAILAGSFVHQLINRGQAMAAALAILISLLYASTITLLGVESYNRWFCSYASLRNDLTNPESGRLPATIGWINSQLPKQSKLLLIGEARAFHFERPILYATCFNTPPGQAQLQSSDTAAKRFWLGEQGITHLLIQWTELERYRQPGNYGFSEWPGRADIEQLIVVGLIRRVPAWPFDNSQAELFEVVPGEEVNPTQ
jgi:hypothetical protein